MENFKNSTDLNKTQSSLCQNNTWQSILNKYPEFADIETSMQQQIIKNAYLINLPQGTEVYTANTTKKQFPLLLQGSLRIFCCAADGREITLYRVSSGDLCILSIAHILKGKQFNVIAKSEKDVSAVILNSMLFLEVMNKSEKFRKIILNVLAERLRDLICVINKAVFHNLHVKVAYTLNNLMNATNSSHIQTTHQQIAYELGTSREVVSRILKDFEKQNCVKLSRGLIKIISHEKIQRLANPIIC